ncbi:phage tail protein I [Acinetobacter sp. ANC 4973]|uniref:phage tail protein I n=1 Tax=Acinetobacter TaxID=469 RepID=UPI000A340D38|nr:phage tail protein I [Acinetobacter sp. ANC 4973]OTH00822.1 phage tail protein I [Acinetobacter sp. ANC 4973]
MAKLLPPNSTQFEINFESAFSRVSNIENLTRKFNDPMTAPSQVLPWLAWEKSVDVWDKNWNEDQKRNAIASSYSIHAHKGTIGALEQAVDALGLNVRIREWFKTVPMLKPYTFEVFVEVSQIGITELQYEKLIDVVNANKNLRSHWKFANTFVISEAYVEMVNLPICCGHDFEYSKTAGSDIFNVWSDWILKLPIAVNQGTSHYKAYKFDNVTTLESYADLDLTQSIVRSLHDENMQQWQAVIDAADELTGVTDWVFDSANSQIVYTEKNTRNMYRFENSQMVEADTFENACKLWKHSWFGNPDVAVKYNESSRRCQAYLVSNGGAMSHTTIVLVSSSTESDEKIISFLALAQKIISNTSSSNQGTSLLAEAYLENVAQSIFSTDESKQFVKLSDLIDQFEENKI